MGILVTCDSCDTEFNASSKAAGKRVKCPSCGEAVRVPMDEDEPAPARRSSSNKASAKRNQNQNSNGLMLGLGIGGGGVAVLAVVFLVLSRGGAGNPPQQQGLPQVAAPTGGPSNPA